MKKIAEIKKIKYCNCGNIFYSKKKQRIFCSRICASNNKIGKPGGMLGKKQSQNQKDLISAALKGKIPKNLEMLHAMPRTEERRNKHRVAQTGERGSNWRGGISSLVQKIRKCFRYRQWRCDIFERDNYTCVLCETRGGTLHADHYPKSFSSIFHENHIRTLEQAINCEELWNINNGRTLCKPCHLKTETWGAKMINKVEVLN